MRLRAASLVTASTCLLIMSGCSSHAPTVHAAGDLTAKQMGYALAIAHSEIHKQQSHIRLAVAELHKGVVQSSNTGHTCESGSLLRVILIGTFPHTAVSPAPGHPSTAHAEIIEADPATGQECLIGAKTGKVRPPHGATRLPGIGS